MGEPLVCVAALIFDPRDRLFMVRRAADRSLFPNSWDVVGGHVEPGESPRAALDREVHEETGWRVGTVLAELPTWTWTGNDGLPRVEHDYLVTVVGDLAAPRLDTAEHTGYRWLAEAELPVLDDDPSLIRQLADAAFVALRSGYAARVAPLLDGAFRAAMGDVAEHGGRELVRRFGGDPARPLIDFRTGLAWPGRWITVRQADAVWRYRDRAACWAGIRVSAGAGFLDLGSEGFRAAQRGREFLTALYALHEEVLGPRWPAATVARASDLLGRVLGEATRTGGDAFAAMAPPYEDGAGPATVLLNRIGTLRYHRLDAHVAAAEDEAQTDRLAAPPFAVLDPGERAALAADLAGLDGG